MNSFWRLIAGRRSSQSSRTSSSRHSSARSHGLAQSTPAGESARAYGSPSGRREPRRRLSLGGLAAAAIVVAGGVWLGWRILADTAAYNAAAIDPEIAYAWNENEGRGA